MADYIYLLQNRLTPAQWRAVEAVRESARAHSMPVFLVGGAIRDLTTGSPVRDLDFAVQGDVERLVSDLEQGGTTVTGRNQVLSSAYLRFRGGVRAEIGPTLTVTYPKPGQAVAQSASILDDLRRRDFTANAMAVSLNEGSYGLLLDPLNGTADLENRELRLVSAYGFIENPALLLRASRLSQRLGWSLEDRTASRYQTSKEEGHLQAISRADRGYELEEIFHEEDPISIMEHMAEEGWLAELSPALRPEDADRNAIEAVRDLIGQLEGQGLYPDPSAIYFPSLAAKMSDNERADLKSEFVRPGFVEQIGSIEARAKDLAGQLTSKAAALPSEVWKLLKQAEPEFVLWLAVHTRTGAVQAKIKSFLKDWPQMRQKLPYALMQEMRITPELPEYEKLLDDLFFALIDGKLDTPEATRAFLEPFSPPAPPQVTVRRRPAKAAKGRGKRAAAAAVVAPERADDGDEDEDDEQDPDEREPIQRRSTRDDDDGEGPEVSVEDEPSGSLGGVRAADHVEDDDSESELHVEHEPAASKVHEAAPAVAAPVAARPEGAKAAKKVAKANVAHEAVSAPAKATPAQHVSAKPASAAQKATVVPAAKKVAHKVVAPAKQTPAHKSAPVKVAVKAAAPAKKIAAKGQPAKAPAKAVLKKTAGKPAPAKTIAAKKGIPAKVPAKGQSSVKGRDSHPAKKGAPAKHGKKAAVKGRKR